MSPVLSSIRSALPNVCDCRPRRFRGGLLVVLWTLTWGILRVQAAGTLANLDRDNGLPTAQLGAPITSFQGLEKTEDVGRWLTFKRPADTLRYGKYAVTGITYNFFKDRLYSINLDVQGKGNVKGIIKLLEQNYGKDHTLDVLPFSKVNATMDVREWAATRVYCVMKNGSDEQGGVLTLLDKPTWDLIQVPKREKLEASKQLLGGSFINGDLDRKAPPTPAPAPPAPAPVPQSLAPGSLRLAPPPQ